MGRHHKQQYQQPRRRKIAVEIEDISYKNTSLLMNFVDNGNKILGRKSTGLDAKKQRKIQKAIKQARSLGLMPL